MKHLYINGDNEYVAADSKFQAAKYYEQELGGKPDAQVNVDDWHELLDSGELPRDKRDEPDTAGEAAAKYSSPTIHSPVPA